MCGDCLLELCVRPISVALILENETLFRMDVYAYLACRLMGDPLLDPLGLPQLDFIFYRDATLGRLTLSVEVTPSYDN
jgi:hypothetical protein